MSALLFALVGSFITGVGARDQMLVARLRLALEPSTGLLGTAMLSAVATAAIAAWIGAELSRLMSASAATMFLAFALLAGAFELAWPNRVARPEEPTRSLGAIFIVLFARQMSDASRFVILALAVAQASPMLAGLGGAIAGSASVTIGWAMGDELERTVPLRTLRVSSAIVLAIAAILIGLSARGLIG